MTENTIDIEEIRRQIGEGQGHIAKQVDRIRRLEADGQDSSEARADLDRLNEAQQLYLDAAKRHGQP